MNSITTHILDVSRGRPAENIAVKLFFESSPNVFALVGEANTNVDGRVKQICAHEIEIGMYRLRFETGAYFARAGSKTFFPYVEINFMVEDPKSHYHVPLLLSPFSYSTYRGS